MKTTALAADTLSDLVQKLGAHKPDFVSVHLNCDLPFIDIAGHLPETAAFHGSTSCLGAMTTDGVEGGVAAFVIEDPEGSYGSAAYCFDGDPKRAASDAVSEALTRADRIGEDPDLVWVSATPGVEEEVLAGIQSVVGSDVPIIGGSAADNSVEGNWFVFDQQQRSDAGVVVTVLFPSTRVSFAYQNGYSPSAAQGIVTRATGRTIHEIDDRPAMEVYSEWTLNAVTGPTGSEGSKAVLSDSTLWPLGREMNRVHDVPFYLLAHPATAHTSGDIDLFATVAEGEVLTLMTGTVDSLTDRAGRVAALARKLGPGPTRPIAGALMIYCGGCMLRVREELPRVVSGVNAALDEAPFLGAFTFGEQGPLIDAGNRHGNLMISCIVFEAE